MTARQAERVLCCEAEVAAVALAVEERPDYFKSILIPNFSLSIILKGPRRWRGDRGS